MDLITAEHVRELENAAPGSALVVSGGSAQVVAKDVQNAGYLVIGREDLQGLLGSSSGQTSYDDIARSLNSAVVEMGG